MLDFLNVANEVIVLITGLLGLLGTGVGVFFAVKNWIKAMKEKTSKEQWALIMEMADAAMAEAEASVASGEDKKQIVMDSISTAMQAAGIEAEDFTKQLSDYIDQTIDFVNKMKKAKN